MNTPLRKLAICLTLGAVALLGTGCEASGVPMGGRPIEGGHPDCDPNEMKIFQSELCRVGE